MAFEVKRLFKIKSVGFFLLSFFAVGLTAMILAGPAIAIAAQNHGLAGPAVILGYGLGYGLLAVIGGILLVGFSKSGKIISLISMVLIVIFLLSITWLSIQYWKKGNEHTSVKTESVGEVYRFEWFSGIFTLLPGKSRNNSAG